MLITAIVNSILAPPESRVKQEAFLHQVSDDQLFKECSTVLKDYFPPDFIVELKDNKSLLFQLYRLYLLNTLVLRMKAVEDDPNHPVLKKRGRGALVNPQSAY